MCNGRVSSLTADDCVISIGATVGIMLGFVAVMIIVGDVLGSCKFLSLFFLAMDVEFSNLKRRKEKGKREREESLVKLEYCTVEISVRDGELLSSALNRGVHQIAGDVLPCIPIKGRQLLNMGDSCSIICGGGQCAHRY